MQERLNYLNTWISTKTNSLSVAKKLLLVIKALGWIFEQLLLLAEFIFFKFFTSGQKSYTILLLNLTAAISFLVAGYGRRFYFILAALLLGSVFFRACQCEAPEDIDLPTIKRGLRSIGIGVLLFISACLGKTYFHAWPSLKALGFIGLIAIATAISCFKIMTRMTWQEY